MPTSVSIVRATAMDPARGYATDDQSPNLLLDPARPPLEPLRLVVIDPFEVRFRTPARAGGSVVVLDELGLVVARSSTDEGQSPRCQLVPGHYLARVVDPAGASPGEAVFDVVDAALEIALP